MTNIEHLKKLHEGVGYWNSWRKEDSALRPDLSRADLSDAELPGIDFSNSILDETNFQNAILTEANFNGAFLRKSVFVGAKANKALFWYADLSDAIAGHSQFSDAVFRRARLGAIDFRSSKLSGVDFSLSYLWSADFSNSELIGATFQEANLNDVDFSNADLESSDLSEASLVRANFEGANLSNSSVYGISAWDLNLKNSNQSNLQVSGITVDNLEVAQFIYLLLHNEKIRDVIDTISSTIVLILGRFSPERKPLLDGIRIQLRELHYLPVLFDFEKPDSRDTIETVSTLAHMSRFVIADLTDAKSVLQELQHIVLNLPSVPIQPILLSSEDESGMLDYFRQFQSFLKIYRYDDVKDVLNNLESRIIAPAVDRLKRK